MAKDLVLEETDLLLELVEGLVESLVAGGNLVGIGDGLEGLQTLFLAALGCGHAVALEELLALDLRRLVLAP
jgi:hypothetical protein